MTGNGGRVYQTERNGSPTLRVVSDRKAMFAKNDEALEAAMSRPIAGSPLRDIVVLTAALALLAACGSRAVAPPSDPASVVSSGPPIAHVREQPSPTASASGTAPPQAISRAFANPRQVAIAEARAVCNFDWQQSLAARLDGARNYATATYAWALSPSANDKANWLLTQQDRESATCTGSRVSALSGAPNSATVRYEHVEMTQRASVRGKRPALQQFEVSYRLERQFDGRWLVGAESDGG